jgi:hypothetical protein
MRVMKWDLWVDFMCTDENGLTHANRLDAAPGLVLEPGMHVIVGDEDADPAVAEVVSVDEYGIVLVRVLPGPAEQHLHLVSSQRS